jgi:hypothetical protein
MVDEPPNDSPAKRAPMDYKQEEFSLRRGTPVLPRLPGEGDSDYTHRVEAIYYARIKNFRSNRASFTDEQYALEDKILDAMHDALDLIALRRNPDGRASG